MNRLRPQIALIGVAVLLALIALVLISGCGQQQTSSEPFRITINTWVGFAPLYLAQEKGFFKKHGLQNVEIVKMDDTTARKVSMEAGRIEGYASSVDNWALDSAHGVHGKIVMGFDESAGGDGIVAKKSIKKLSDLKGKTVAAQPGMPGQFLLFHLLSKAGLSPSDVKFIEMDSDKAGAAFVAGKLDAAVTWEPWLSKASTSGGHILASTKENRGLIVDVLVVPPDVLSKRPKDVQAVMLAWFDALDYWKTHKDESDKIMAKALGLNPADFSAMCAGVNHLDLVENRAYFGTSGKNGPIFGVFDSASRVWLGQHITKLSTKSSEEIDSSLLSGLK